MAVLLSGIKLQERLADLARQSEGIDIAVAWVGKSDALENVLKPTAGKVCDAVRLLVGVGGYVTHPDALTEIREKANLKVYKPLDGLFHPKLYIFHAGPTPVCWVGSANLTKPGFSKNLELVLEVEDTDKSLRNWFEQLWESQESDATFDIEKYRQNWKKNRKRLPPFLKDEAGSQQNAVGIDVLKGNWTSFAEELKQQDDYKEAVRTLSAGYNFVRRDWSMDLNDEEDQILRALGSFTAFGILKHIPKGAFRGPSENAASQRRKVGEALAGVIESGGQLESKIIGKAFADLMLLNDCGRALASRLLLFARPDSCVVVTRKSVEYQGKAFKMKLTEKPTGEQYGRLIDAVRLEAWWRASRPTDPEDAKLWDYRAALTDIFAFREWTDEAG